MWALIFGRSMNYDSRKSPNIWMQRILSMNSVILGTKEYELCLLLFTVLRNCHQSTLERFLCEGMTQNKNQSF